MTEFYLYGDDGKRIVGEVENVGPGITRELVLKVEPGKLHHRLQAGHGRRWNPRTFCGL